jgi:hypothetical protein
MAIGGGPPVSLLQRVSGRDRGLKGRGGEGEASLTVTVRAKADFAVLVGNSSKVASVPLKLTSR